MRTSRSLGGLLLSEFLTQSRRGLLIDGIKETQLRDVARSASDEAIPRAPHANGLGGLLRFVRNMHNFFRIPLDSLPSAPLRLCVKILKRKKLDILRNQQANNILTAPHVIFLTGRVAA